MHDILEFQQASRSLAFRRRLETTQRDEIFSKGAILKNLSKNVFPFQVLNSFTQVFYQIEP